MNVLLNKFDDPDWQALALVITLAAAVLMVAMSTHHGYASVQKICQILRPILPM